ncbi:hypothetical protein ACLM45_01530 [Synechococcus sp. A10-1-5-9]|uniref:hypothetical protein n=1 Tax=Synechococcus sp. A10-1-5-9 TaxID=3392295 RepID=UPI0039EB3302
MTNIGVLSRLVLAAAGATLIWGSPGEIGMHFVGLTLLRVNFAQTHSAAHQLAQEAEKRTVPKDTPAMSSPLPPPPIRVN